MIDERTEEQAALHVIGALDKAEALEFKKRIDADPELQAYVARLSTATGALAGSVPAVAPSAKLRAQILASTEPRQKVFQRNEARRFGTSWFPWLIGAGFAVLCIILNLQDTRLKNTVNSQAQNIADLTQLTQRLQLETNHLQEAVLQLQETNRLANVRIAMLKSQIADSPNSIAVSLWDNQKQNGVFVAQNLKLLPADRDYQLWVLDQGTNPVSAGVFHVNADGTARVDFKALQQIQDPGKFAVTVEPKGGLAAPTLKNLVLIGG